MILAHNPQFKQNFVHILFYLINTVYKAHAKNAYDG